MAPVVLKISNETRLKLTTVMYSLNGEDYTTIAKEIEEWCELTGIKPNFRYILYPFYSKHLKHEIHFKDEVECTLFRMAWKI